MDKKSSEKELLADDDNSKSLIKKVYLIIRANWLALLFALIISLITIIAVPIVYSIEKKASNSTDANLSWDVTGITIFSQKNILSKNLSLGLIAGIGFDSASNLYVVDRQNNRVYQLDKSYQLQTYIGNVNGSIGSDANSLNSPYDIHVDSSDTIYIADTFNHRILYWNPQNGSTKIIFGGGSAGSGNNQLNQPMSVTMDKSSNMMYIADYGNNRIVSYSMTTIREAYVKTPITIKFDSNKNTIVIAQETGYNVIRWDTTSLLWTLIAGSASSELSGTSRTLFNKVCYTNVDMFGSTYVADCNNQRIQYYQGDLTKGRTIAGVILAQGNNPYLFNQPTSVTLDGNNNLIVADSNNYRIQKFKKI